MDHAGYRLRFAIAMGLVGCTKESPRPEVVPTASASAAVTTPVDPPSETPSETPSESPSATATATPSAPPSAVASAMTSATSAPLPTGAPPKIGLPTGVGGCGSDVVCQPEPSSKICAATYTEPKGESGMDPRSGPLYNEAPQHKAGECCYRLPRRFCGGGRPLRADDGPIVAAIVARRDWTRADLATEPAAPDAELAQRWLREAAFEHASVASFARVTLQLMALGAPPDLLADAQRAALDEIEHARTFLALASRRGAGERGPAALEVDRAPLATTFEAFVVETFLDGCLAETVSGIEIRARAEDGDDVEREALARIADEEENHAELAWRMLAWGVRSGGERARAALEETVRRIDDDGPIVRWVVLPCVRALLDVESPLDGNSLDAART